jgi:hypothetical protein
MTSDLLVFCLYIVIAIFIILYRSHISGSFFNVLAINVGTFSLSVILGFISIKHLDLRAPKDTLSIVILNSLIYIISIACPFLFKTSSFTSIYRIFFGIFSLSYISPYKSVSRYVVINLLCIAFVSFVSMAVIGGGGTDWIFNSRDAYMDYRSKVGFLYAIASWMLMLAYISLIWSRKSDSNLKIKTIIFASIATFLGSKGFVLAFIVVGLLYYHFYRYRLSNLTLFVLGFSLLLLFLLMQLLQGTAQNLLDSLRYFEYLYSTVRVFENFSEIGFQNGDAFLGSMWDFVPRALVPSKPVVYGYYIMQETLDPGKFEMGRSVGMLTWTKYYLDFGSIGVAVAGLSLGFILKSCEEFYQKNKSNLFAFILLVHIGYFSLFNYAEIIYVFILLWLFNSLIAITKFIFYPNIVKR